MKFTNEMQLKFLSKSPNEAFSRVVVAAFAAQLDPTLEEIADIKTAVSEAVTNSIIHGYEDTIGYIEIMGKLFDGGLIVQIMDRGKGIANLEEAMQPLYTSKPELERSGMGFTVMQTFMDEVEVSSSINEGTKVTMIKYIGSKKEMRNI
ncbi:MAG: anti-sigma F factor [Clostridiales bacterium]|nr:anti-sigma F factor [Clostridiales bacterium]